MTIANPFSIDALFEAGELVFKCPTCPHAISVALDQIDQIIGANVVCSDCKNVAHVPGAYRTDPKPVGLKITGGVSVTINKFGDWYFSHPLIDSLIKAGQADFLYDYGLWAYCAGCYHQYPATVLTFLPIAQRSGGLVFTAQTPESAKDMESLISGHCPSCGNNSLIVIVADIPNYVRSAIIAKRQKRT